MPRLDETPVTLPRWAVELMVADKPKCGVCLRISRSWDGHDKNPPCVGAAREVAQKALAAAAAAAADA